MTDENSEQIDQLIGFVKPVYDQALKIADSLDEVAAATSNDAFTSLAESFRETYEKDPEQVVEYFNHLTSYFEQAESHIAKLGDSESVSDELKSGIEHFVKQTLECKKHIETFVAECQKL